MGKGQVRLGALNAVSSALIDTANPAVYHFLRLPLQVARKTGQPLAKGRFEGKTYHEGALECMIEKTWKCTWNR